MAAWRDDGEYVYPGDIPESGTFKEQAAVEGWFRRFFEQFPSVHCKVRDVCVRNLFDLAGTNTVAVHWDIHLANREGREGRNNGVTVVNIQGGKVVRAKDYIFDLGENFRKNWSAPYGGRTSR